MGHSQNSVTIKSLVFFNIENDPVPVERSLDRDIIPKEGIS